VLYALLTTGGETRKFYRYQTTDDNVVDYYDRRQERKEVPGPQAGRRWRHHVRVRRPQPSDPRLHQDAYRRGLGLVDGNADLRLGQRHHREGGLRGRLRQYIRIRHANGYETAYGHMSAFARGMEPGKKVRQGQVIGYVGSTGLSTGAHLHYEILINGRFVDPMKIKLPRGRVLESTLLAGFEQERLRLDAMLTRASPSRYAQGR
jgi:hypothetical protein